ncbi:MAG: hypothetical protein NT018_02910 [Armatimonadetes bacterium]|nr:hypothetical protein [Armatimonadota bacterium]
MGRKAMLIAVLAIMAMAASIITAQAQCTVSTPAYEAMGPGLGPKIISDLNLTPAQVDQLKGVKSDFMNATVDLRGQLNVKLNELTALWADPKTTTDQVKAKADEIDVIRTQIRNIGIDYLAKARDILTSEQRAKVDQMIRTNPGWLFGMACTMGMEYFKGTRAACPAAVAKGPTCQAVAPACPKACEPTYPATVGSGPCGCQQVTVPCPTPCPTCTPALPQPCPTCVDLYMYQCR